ncbi:Arc family DNA-binding protein [Brucella gallinifaecis]|uniref:Arc family DNA-binding protein n=1 Tax=Brucella gallinifaecis TaxID=215590 RepID=A0A502BU50_9HYPH|nr:Arc family DNA-binding protein [Brucella gallinifaecis]TPF76696.1 Arc family DNA-binding protein [Brucella gallinifaecis]
MTKVRDQDQFVVRLPDGMRDQIAADAKAKGRSMNAEIVARIANSAPEKTLRDEIAIAALSVFAGNYKATISDEANSHYVMSIAMLSYVFADAMLRAREVQHD